jgi:LydA holin phage, holin superfamily III
MDIWKRVILHGLFAMMGGVVRELLKKNPTMRILDFITGGAVGMFAGMVIYFVGCEYQWTESWMAAMCGMAGFVGPRALEELLPMFRKSSGGK